MPRFRFSRSRPLVARLALVSLLLTAAVSTAACPKRPANLSPAADAAWTADQISARIFELGAVARRAEQSKAISILVSYPITRWCLEAHQVLDKAPNGWQATLGASWAALKQEVPVLGSSDFVIQAAVAAVDAALLAYAPRGVK